MKGIPLLQREDSETTRALLKRAMNLSLKFAPNVLEVLTEEQLEYFEQNLPDLKVAAQRAMDYASPAAKSEVVAKQTKEVPGPLILTSAPFSNQWKKGVVKLYKDFMDLDVTPELEKFEWPAERREGFNWFVFRPQELTTQMAIDKLCKPQFKVEEYIDVSNYSLERTPEQSHLVLCRETVEPDSEWLGKSGDDMSATPTPFLDLCDRVVLEAIYFLVFKKHLDIKGLTRTPRSRHGGRVASAYWAPSYRKFGVDDYYSDFRSADCGGREAIPLPLKTS